MFRIFCSFWGIYVIWEYNDHYSDLGYFSDKKNYFTYKNYQNIKKQTNTPKPLK